MTTFLEMTISLDGFVAAHGVSAENPLARARDAAGDRDVCVMGGGGLARQVLAAGLADELRIHVAPVLLGSGTRLFEDHGDAHVGLELTRTVETPGALHLRHRVARTV